MSNQRRKFMVMGGLAAGAVATGGIKLLVGGSPSERAEREISGIISRYGRQVSRNEKSPGQVHFSVRIEDLGRFASAYRENGVLTSGQIYASGNTLKIGHGGVSFTLDHIV